MRRFFVYSFAAAALSAVTSAAVIPVQGKPAPPPPPAEASADVSVTATYKGKGVVDEKHAITVFLFDHPVPTGDSRPLASQVATKNGQTVVFKSVTADPVYVTLVYDEKSNYDGQSAPPPGAPIGSYAKAGKPLPVKPGTKVVATFDDSRRWK
jgi:hypothetical protein